MKINLSVNPNHLSYNENLIYKFMKKRKVYEAYLDEEDILLHNYNKNDIPADFLTSFTGDSKIKINKQINLTKIRILKEISRDKFILFELRSNFVKCLTYSYQNVVFLLVKK